MIGCLRRTAGCPEGIAYACGARTQGGIGQDPRDGIAQLGRLDAAELEPDPSTCGDDLIGDDRLVVLDRCDRERQTVGERLARRVVAAVTDDSTDVREPVSNFLLL